MADWSQPQLTSLYIDFLAFLDSRLDDTATLFNIAPTNQPTNTIRFFRSSNTGLFQQWDSATWVDQLLNVAGGGTGSSTASGARTNLGLGTLATQNANAVNITGGTVAGETIPSGIDGSAITTGVIDAARLPAVTVFLPGMMMLWGGAAAPSGWVLCDGSAISRTTFVDLFTAIGIAFGAGNGSTTFNVPDLRQRFPLGKAASGTGVTLGSTGGAIDHTHTGPSHTHTGPSHTHTVNSHTHSIADHQHVFDTTTRGAHTHNGTTGTESSAGCIDTIGGGSCFASMNHTHGFTTDSNGDHHHDGSITNLGGTTVTGGTSPATDAAGTGATGASGTGATSANNPPFQVVNYIIKT